MHRKSWRYFKREWGALFVLAFIVLLVISASLLGAGLQDLSNQAAMYAYHALVLGIGLQIVSFLRHGESTIEREPTQVPGAKPKGSLRFHSRKVKITAVAVIVGVIAGVGTIAAFYPSAVMSLFHGPYPTLSASVDQISVPV